MPTSGHDWCPEPIGGTCQSTILPELLWCRPGVSVLCSPSPGFWPNSSLVGTTHIKLLTMVSSTETTASTSTAGVTPPSRLLPRDPTVELMDTLLPLTTENLLATAGVGRGHKPQAPPRIPTAPGLRQMRPKTPQQQVPTPGRQEATQATPY